MDNEDYERLLETMRIYINAVGCDETAFSHILKAARLLMDEYKIDDASEDAASCFEPLEQAISCLC